MLKMYEHVKSGRSLFNTVHKHSDVKETCIWEMISIHTIKICKMSNRRTVFFNCIVYTDFLKST